MNILEQTEALKDLPDQALVKEMQMPTGMAPPVFITAELKRRQRMRDEFKRREAQDMPTVAEEVVMAAGMPQGGIADAARAMAPKSSIAQNTGMNEIMPAAATRAPQRMAEGGIVRMARGGRTPVEYNGRGYFVFADGDVQDALGRPVSDEVAEAVKASLETPPKVMDESAAPTGSEVLQEAAPQAPSLESVLSSDRPFSPQQMDVTDTRPAVPPSLGMGGERPATLTAATQPTALSEMEKARLATEFTQQQELARAIRDQQEQRPNLSGPSISDVSPTVDLDLTGQYENRDAIERFNKRTFGKPMTPADKAEERLLMSNMNIPPDSPFAEFAGVDNPETQLIYEGSSKDYMDESEDFYDDISKNLLPPQASSSAERGFDPLAPLAQERAARAVLAQQARLEPVGDARTIPETSVKEPLPTDTEGLMNLLQEQMIAKTGASVGDNQGLAMGKAAEALSSPFLAAKDLKDNQARLQENISKLGLSPTTIDGKEYFIGNSGQVYNVTEDFNLEETDIKEAMQAIDVAQRQGADFTKSPVGTMPIGTRGVDPNTGLVDPDSPFVPASLNIGGLETPDFVDQAFKDGNLSLGNILNRDVVSSDSPDQPPKLTPTGFSPDPEALQLDDSVVDMAASTGTPTLGGGDPAIERGIASALAQDVSARNVVTAPTIDGGGGGGGIVPTGGAATGLEARIAQMLSDREKDRETDKYMALAQAGLALMASKNPTLGGAIGEAGLAGVGALRKAKSQYDADILGLMGLEEKARSSRLSREAALAKANRPKTMTGTERVGLLREAGDLREELIKLKADIAREGTLGDFGQVTPFTPEQLSEKVAQARLLESEINKYKGMAYPQLANVQTVNP